VNLSLHNMFVHISSCTLHIVVVVIYRNEKEVGVGIKKSGIPRSDIFVVTKVWGDGHGYERCKKEFDKSLKR